MLRVCGISKCFGDRTILDTISFSLGGGQKVALVGPNGCGKSTLLKVLSGAIEPDKGAIEWSGRAKVGYLSQRIEADESQSVLSFLAGQTANTAHALRQLESALAGSPEDSELLARYSATQECFEAAGGYDLEAKIERVLAGLEMPGIELDRPLSCLSGGQRTRMSLARVLLLDADILLLDEPTNDLDLPSLEWLESVLTAHESSFILVSHDRRLLDRVTERTMELDPFTGKLKEYGGNYSWYRKRKAEEEERQLREYKEQQDRMRVLEFDIRKTKQQALSTERATQNDYLRGRAKKVAAKAKAREARIERMLSSEHRKEKPRQQEKMRLALPDRDMHRSLLLELRAVSLQRNGRPLLANVDVELRGNQRVAIAGRNGAGKSSLLQLLIGGLSPAAGTVTRRSGLRVAYLPQLQETLLEDSSVLDFTMSFARKGMSESEIRTFLHRFLFSKDDVFKKIGQLSYGERTKLLLASFMLSSPDLLILDEPTNHLDIASIECLESALCQYKGALIVVSHDRYFVDSLRLDATWLIDGGRLTIEYR